MNRRMQDRNEQELIEILTMVVEDGFSIPELEDAEAIVDDRSGVIVVFNGQRVRLTATTEADPKEPHP